MKKEKRKTNELFIVIILLILSLFCVVKYAMYSKDFGKKELVANNENTNKKEMKKESSSKEEDVELSSQLAIELQKKISIFDSYQSGSYYGYFYQKNKLKTEDISSDAKIAIGITQHKGFDRDFASATYNALTPDNKNVKVIILSKEEIQDGINAFFGPNTEYNDQSLKDADDDYCGFSQFVFDKTRDVYMSEPFTCAGFPKPYIDSKITKIIKKGTKVEVNVKIAYIKFDVREDGNATQYVYRRLDDDYSIEKHELLTDNSYNIDKILDKLDTFKFTFTLNSNNYYYFSQVEKV